MAYYTPSPKYQTEIVARRGYDGVGGVLETFGSKIESAASGTLRVTGTALDIIGGRTQQPTVVQQESRTPGWVMPVAIGGLVLGAVLLLTRKKSAQTSNPARRHNGVEWNRWYYETKDGRTGAVSGRLTKAAAIKKATAEARRAGLVLDRRSVVVDRGFSR